MRTAQDSRGGEFASKAPAPSASWTPNALSPIPVVPFATWAVRSACSARATPSARAARCAPRRMEPAGQPAVATTSARRTSRSAPTASAPGAVLLASARGATRTRRDATSPAPSVSSAPGTMTAPRPSCSATQTASASPSSPLPRASPSTLAPTCRARKIPGSSCSLGWIRPRAG